MQLMAWLAVTMFFVMVLIFNIKEDPGDLFGVATYGLVIGGFGLASVAMLLSKHQLARQLRQPPLLGHWLVSRRNCVAVLVFVGSGAGFDMVLVMLGLDKRLPGKKPIRSVIMFGAMVGFFVTIAVVEPLTIALNAATTRAALRTKAGWLRLARAGGANTAELVNELAAAHTELQAVVGTSDVFSGWLVAAVLCRALVEAGRKGEVAAVQAALARQLNAAQGRSWLRAVPTRIGPFSWDSAGPKNWRRNGPYLLAGLAAAARAPDAEVLALLQEAAAAGCDTLVGSRSLRHKDDVMKKSAAGQPEWTEFLVRMRGEGEGEGSRSGDRRAWAALPAEMTVDPLG
jgi:hypothetical protein